MSLRTLVFQIQKNKRPIRLKSPVPYNIYKSIILEGINNINEKNEDNLKTKYSYYIEKFGDIISKKGSFYPVDFGFSSNNRSVSYYLDRGYTQNYAQESISKMQSLTSKKSFIERYGDKGEDKFRKYVSRKSKSYSRNYKEGLHKEFYRPSQIKFWTNKGFTENEAMDKMFDVYSASSLKFHENKRKEGKEWLTCRQIKFWTNKGLSIKDAHEQIKKICDTRSMDFFIEKYGNELGPQKFKNTNLKWQKSLNNKSDEEKLRINISKFKNGTRYSKKSIHFFDILISHLRYDGKYYYKEKEHFIFDEISKKIFFYDLYLKDLNLLIEYNGILFHPNKKKLNEIEWNNWKNPYTGEGSSEKYKKDQYKIQVAKEKGFNIIEVWENETLSNNISKIENYIEKI
jgi:CRISPR/Cas system CMR-associated protein Cmr5 small subunit